MPIQIIPQKSNKIEGLGNMLNSGLSDISGSLSTLSDRYADMRKQKQQEEHQTKLKQLEQSLKGQREQEKRQYETQQEQDKQRAIQDQNRLYNSLAYGNRGYTYPQDQLNGEQQPGAGGFGPNLHQGERNQQAMGDPERERLINAISGANLSQEKGSEILKQYDHEKLEKEKLAEAQRGHDLTERGQDITRKAPALKQVNDEARVLLDKRNLADDNIRELNKLDRLNQSGKAQAGWWNAFGNKIGVNNLGLSPEGELFDKIASTFSLETMNTLGKEGIGILNHINKTNPSIWNSKQGKDILIKQKILKEEVNKIVGDELIKIRGKSKTKEFDLDSLEEAYDNSKEKIEKLYSKNNTNIRNFSEENGIPVESQYYEPKVNEEESAIGALGRNALSAGTHLASGVAGAPSSAIETLKGISGLADKAGSYLTDALNPNLKKEHEQVTGKPYPTESPVTKGLGAASEFVPGSRRIKEEIGKTLPEGSLQPRNSFEKAVNETAEDIGSIVGSSLLGGGKNVLNLASKAAKLALPANLAKLVTTEMGGSESTGDKVKTGMMIFSSLDLHKPMMDVAKKSYEKLGENVPEVLVKTPLLRPTIKKIRDKWIDVGYPDAEQKKAAGNFISRLEDKIVNSGEMNLRELWQYKKDNNEIIRKLRDTEPGSAGIAFHEKLGDSLNKSIKDNPSVPSWFSKELINTDSIYKQLAQSDKNINYLQSQIKGQWDKGIISTIFSTGLKNIATTKADIKLAKFAAILKGLSKDPKFAKAYTMALKGAAEKNPDLIHRAFKNIQDQEKEGKFDNVEWENLK